MQPDLETYVYSPLIGCHLFQFPAVKNVSTIVDFNTNLF